MNYMRSTMWAVVLFGVAAVLGVGAYFLLRTLPPETKGNPARTVVVMRTRGGMLELSTIRANELFDRTVSCQFLIVFGCGKSLTRTSVVAHYTYRIRLAPEWQILNREGEFIVIVPKVEPLVPVALDTATLKRETFGRWSFITAKGEQDDALAGMSKLLAVKAASRDYIELQRASARLTAGEFVRKWLISQAQYRNVRQKDVRVVFEDESVRDMGPMW